LKILEKKDDFIVYRNKDGETHVTPNNVYNNIKLSEYSGERIHFKKGKHEIQETYNPMIFNISSGKEHLQTRKLDANRVAEAIEHLKKGEYNHFKDLWNAYNSANVDIGMLSNFLNRYKPRVFTHDEGFIIDDRFMVDRKGSSWVKVKAENYDRTIVRDHRDHSKSHYKYLCLVSRGVSPKEVKLKNGDTVKMSALALNILSKIEFCLEPLKHKKDHVFWNQVPGWLKKEIQAK